MEALVVSCCCWEERGWVVQVLESVHWADDWTGHVRWWGGASLCAQARQAAERAGSVGGAGGGGEVESVGWTWLGGGTGAQCGV